MKCKDCGTIFRGKLCPCGWSPTRSAPKTINCKTCNVIHKTEYIILGQCHNCHEISQMNPVDREHYRLLASQSGLKLFDIPVHIRAANALNQPIETYLASLPRSLSQYKSYWRGKNPSLGGVPLL